VRLPTAHTMLSVLLPLMAASQSAHAQTRNEIVLYNFVGGQGDGANPYAALIQDSAGNLYGTTYGGGSPSCSPPYGCGTVFKLDSTGKETLLYSFTGGSDGGNPNGELVQDAAGNLYGTTYTGADGCGTVFKLDSTGKETTLHTFGAPGGNDGCLPVAGVTRDSAGNLYGTTWQGGVKSFGIVFQLDTQGNESILYSFAGGTDGKFPFASLVRDSAGNLYGTSRNGGFSTVRRSAAERCSRLIRLVQRPYCTALRGELMGQVHTQV
jgi:uncharacterized repeat protein (TIGR03803 family)